MFYTKKKVVSTSAAVTHAKQPHVTSPARARAPSAARHPRKRGLLTSGRSITHARSWWLRGFCLEEAVFEMTPDKNEKPYMPHKNKKMMPFRGNHSAVSAGNPGALIIGLHHLRKRHRSIVQNRVNQKPQDLGLFILYLCEGPKLQPVFLGLCKSFVDPSLSRLDKVSSRITDIIRNWSSLSNLAMHYMDSICQGLPPPKLRSIHCIPDSDTIQNILEIIRILHLGAYNSGMFIHNKERVETWQIKVGLKSKSKQTEDSRRRKEAEGKGEDSVCTETPMDDSFHTLGIAGKIQSLKREEKRPTDCLPKTGRMHPFYIGILPQRMCWSWRLWPSEMASAWLWTCAARRSSWKVTLKFLSTSGHLKTSVDRRLR